MSPQRGITAARSFQSGSHDLTPSDYFTKDWQGGMKTEARFARIYRRFGLAALTLGLPAGGPPGAAAAGSRVQGQSPPSPHNPARGAQLYNFHNYNAVTVV